MRSRLLPAEAVAAAVLLCAILPAAPAQAHPFGPPQTAEVSAADGRLHVQWRFGASDDVSYLGAALGALPQERVLLDGAVLHEDSDDLLLSESAGLPGYVLEHISATRAGDDCAGTVSAGGDLSATGIGVNFDCPGQGGEVEVTITMLTDLHPAFITLASGPDGQRAAYSEDAPSHPWQVGENLNGTQLAERAGLGQGTSAVLQLGGVLTACAAAIGGLGWLRRRRRAASCGSDSGLLN